MKLKAQYERGPEFRSIKRRGRKVVCLELNKVFDTLVDARSWLVSEGFEKACPSAIGRVCRNKIPKAYGYTWEYLND